MNEDSMPTPCADCGDIVDFQLLKEDPLGEYDMVYKFPVFAKRKPRSMGLSLIDPPVIGIKYCPGKIEMFDKPISYKEYKRRYE